MKQPMKLDGGLDMYVSSIDKFGGRYKTEESPYGRKVKFTAIGGYDMEIETALDYFKYNQILTVKEIYVGRSNSKVEFIELEGRTFNTVMFEDVENYNENKF